jgi:hypothetical protein
MANTSNEGGITMRRPDLFAAALLVAAAGTSVPGCSFPDAQSLGRFCASPAEGGEFCVSSFDDPSSAWTKAAEHGSLPIQMWAEYPQAITLDHLVKSRDDLDRWFADVDRVVTYVRDTQGSAESYKASMEGKLGGLLREAKDRQAELLAQKPVDAAGHFKQAITQKANAEKDPLLAVIATDKQAMGGAQSILENAQADVAPLAKQYASIVTDFAAYRATEAAETDGYTKLSADASKATLDTLDGVEQAILAAAQAASAKPNDLSLGAMKLSAKIQQFELASQAAIAPYADFMATHGAALPDMTSGALRSLDAMLGYIERRVARSDATATSLLVGVGMRRQALKLLTASQPAREQVAEAKLQGASKVFASSADARLAALGPLPQSVRLALPYLARRYDDLTALLQMKPLCDIAAAASFREAGCAALAPHFKEAAAYRGATLPQLIATGLATMRAKGVDAALLDAAQAKLDAGDVRGAAILHDAALRGAEGT